MPSTSEDAAPREWRLYVDDMVACCDKVLAYTMGIDRRGLVGDPMRYDATLRNLELIGEAATHIPAETRATADDVPRRMVIALRNRLIHGYLGIDDDTVWSIVRDDVAPLRKALVPWLTARE
jgi:uncharacterized protein with HEPN domain